MKQIALDPLSIAANAGQTTKKYKATPHRRNLSGIVENMIRFTYE
jgi:hypothetical protein